MRSGANVFSEITVRANAARGTGAELTRRRKDAKALATAVETLGRSWGAGILPAGILCCLNQDFCRAGRPTPKVQFIFGNRFSDAGIQWSKNSRDGVPAAAANVEMMHAG